MAVKTSWSAGDVLTAADLTDTFAAKVTGETGSTEPTGKSAGYLWGDTNAKVMKVYTGSAWLSMGKVLQVASTTKADTFSTNSTSLTDVTGLSVTITPSSTTSLVLVMVSLSLSVQANSNAWGAIVRGSTVIGGGTAASNRPSGSFATVQTSVFGAGPLAHFVLDSPASASATTYKVRIATESGTNVYVNRGRNDDVDTPANPRLASTITVMEVAA